MTNLRRILTPSAALILALGSSVTAAAQDGTIVYRLGSDTVAIEQFTRSASRMSGEMVTRSGAAVARWSYDLTMAAGRVTAATVKRMQGDGSAVPNAASEYRFAFRADSAIRTTVFADSQQVRAFAAANAVPVLPVFAYGIFEALRLGNRRDSIPAIPAVGGAVAMLGMEQMPDGTTRLKGAPYAMLLTFDAGGRLQKVDGTFTTNKSVGTRVGTKVDIAATGRAMKPTGILSPRLTAYAAFQQGPITINYGSPAVRGRSVWGGTLVPFDTVWRTGANEAAHLATSKTIQLGEMTIAPGLYTLWIQHTQAATWLIVNKQVGQWGTGYNPANDIGRVAMTLTATPDHVEDFTITVRPLPQGRGAFEFAWGDKVATAQFALRQ